MQLINNLDESMTFLINLFNDSESINNLLYFNNNFVNEQRENISFSI